MSGSVRWIALVVWCAVLVLSPTSGLTQSRPAQEQERKIEQPDSRAVNRMRTIVREVHHELVTLPFYGVFDWLDGEVKPDGTVILRGEVTRPTLQKDAEKRVREIESVTNVVNEIRVLPLSSFDDDLRIAIYRAMFNGNSPLMMYGLRSVPPIHIIVEGGRATLKGVVATEMDKQLASNAARGLPGLLELKNELRVEAKASK